MNIDAVSVASVSDGIRLNLVGPWAIGRSVCFHLCSLWQNDFPDIDRSDQALSWAPHSTVDSGMDGAQLSWLRRFFTKAWLGLGGIYQVNQVSLSLALVSNFAS